MQQSTTDSFIHRVLIRVAFFPHTHTHTPTVLVSRNTTNIIPHNSIISIIKQASTQRCVALSHTLATNRHTHAHTKNVAESSDDTNSIDTHIVVVVVCDTVIIQRQPSCRHADEQHATQQPEHSQKANRQQQQQHSVFLSTPPKC